MPKILFTILFILAMLFGAQAGFADDSIPRNAGEAQSTVVPPGKKMTQCPAGRFLVTNDRLRPPEKGLVLGRDLDKVGGAFIEATFNEIPHPELYYFNTNDHDLVTLSNGDVLYLTGAGLRTPINPKPIWFDVSFRRDYGGPRAVNGAFGPGARSGLLVWRSKDCGQTFQYISQFDPARAGLGYCAFPQYPRSTTPPGSPDKPVFDMGGSDGQLVKIDAATDNLYLTFPCVGGYPDADQTLMSGHLELGASIAHTLVAASYDKGATWKTLGFINTANWRMGIVPLEAGNIGFGFSNLVTLARKDSTGIYQFDETGIPTPADAYGWNDLFYKNPRIPSNLIYVNIHAHTIAARTPGSSNFFITVPNTITNSIPGVGSHGYRVFFFNREHKTLSQGFVAFIRPAITSSDNFLMHLTEIDLGEGPVLLYWYDIDSAKKSAMIRGRWITGESQATGDFFISRFTPLQPRVFSLGVDQYWYGDYLTASGYVIRPKQPPTKTSPQRYQYVYYPMWVEPDSTIRYTKLTYTTDLLDSPPDTRKQQVLPSVRKQRAQRHPVAVVLSKIKPSSREPEIRDYGKRKRENESVNIRQKQ